jgi:hypothetical protein
MVASLKRCCGSPGASRELGRRGRRHGVSAGLPEYLRALGAAAVSLARAVSPDVVVERAGSTQPRWDWMDGDTTADPVFSDCHQGAR